jgi:hypothetical protein
MFYLKDYQLQWISFWLISLFEKLDKNIEIGNNEWHGAPFGEIETNQEISEFKILVGTNVSHGQTV